MVKLVKSVADSLWQTSAVIVVVSALAVAITIHAFGLKMSGGVALYFVIWWTLLFAVLPFGVRSQAEAGDVAHGTEPGAPAAPALREKAIWTTFVSAATLVFTAGVLPLSGL